MVLQQKRRCGDGMWLQENGNAVDVNDTLGPKRLSDVFAIAGIIEKSQDEFLNLLATGTSRRRLKTTLRISHRKTRGHHCQTVGRKGFHTVADQMGNQERLGTERITLKERVHRQLERLHVVTHQVLKHRGVDDGVGKLSLRTPPFHHSEVHRRSRDTRKRRLDLASGKSHVGNSFLIRLD